MLQTLPALVLFAGLATPAQDAAPTDDAQKAPKIFQIGKPIDRTIELKGVDGKVHRLADYREKVVVIDFWSNRCPWSRKAEPALIALRAEFATKGVVFLAIDSNKGDIADGEKDGFKEIHAYNRENGVNYPVLLDPGNVVADRFQARTTPHLFVIDREGILRYDGGIDDDPKGTKPDRTPWLRDAIVAVLAGEQVPVAKTKAFGCTIKRVPKADQ